MDSSYSLCPSTSTPFAFLTLIKKCKLGNFLEVVSVFCVVKWKDEDEREKKGEICKWDWELVDSWDMW